MINFKASNFKGDCFIDEDFKPYLDKMNTVLINHNMVCIVTSSFRKDTNVKGAIVKPAAMSNHLVGHGIDFNLLKKDTNEYFNSTKLGDGHGDDEICLRDILKVSNLTWGQTFNHPDSVHLADQLNINNPEKWKELYNKYHGQ